MGYPKKIQIETFLGCNARCTYCTVHEWKREHGAMTDEVFARIVEQLIPIGRHVQAISLYMDGEPLMDRQMERRVKELKSHNLPHIGFATNGALLSESRARDLLEGGLDWLAISFDSLNKESFEKVRLRLKFDTVLQNIKRFFELRNEGGFHTKVILRHVNSVDDPEELVSYKSYWSEYLDEKDIVQSFDVHNWGNGKSPPDQDWLAPCSHVFDNMVILRDGTVPLCCIDYDGLNAFGNVMTTPLMEIWNSPRWEEVRQAHRAGRRADIAMCGTCDVPEQVDIKVDPGSELRQAALASEAIAAEVR
jgi:sulfatase maturation enzyme AslB (radical SAM superfamily)